MESLNGEILEPGMTVWADQVLDSPGNVMRAEVVKAGLEPGLIHFHFGQVCRSQCVMIRQLPTVAAPIPAGAEPWVTYWPANKLLAV